MLISDHRKSDTPANEAATFHPFHVYYIALAAAEKQAGRQPVDHIA
jgi:hypothetical protein